MNKLTPYNSVYGFFEFTTGEHPGPETRLVDLATPDGALDKSVLLEVVEAALAIDFTDDEAERIITVADLIHLAAVKLAAVRRRAA